MAIKILSDELVSSIAAGEVVERPYSVVKELVENSLDAGAQNITVELQHGGIKLIKVVDDGCGIAANELDLAFKRFATSKINENSGIAQIKTLGFRGEALPAIASVSHVEMLTRQADAEHGTRYVIDYGYPQTSEPIGAPFGTTVLVSDIFHNTPARFKFLSSATYEGGRIQQLINSLALINANVCFKLVMDSKLKFSSLGSGDDMTTATDVYTAKIAEAMIVVDEIAVNDIAVKGLISSPNIRRRNRTGITLAINGRLIQDRLLMAAVKQAYRGYLGEHDFPVVVLNITMPHEGVDVNVHPAKTEVRFANKDAMFSVLQSAIRGTLIDKAGVPEFKQFTKPTETSAQTEQTPHRVPPNGSVPNLPNSAEHQMTNKDWLPNWPEQNSPKQQFNAPPTQFTHREILPTMKFVGQIQKTYLITDTINGMYLIDQHAAHERVTYDRINHAMKTNNKLEIQQLLAPETVELSVEIIAFVDEYRAKLEKFGFQLEQFGQQTVLVRGIPAILLQRESHNTAKLITEILEVAPDSGQDEHWRQRIIATIACHSSIRAGHTMEAVEGNKLIEKLAATAQPQTCPHGRPTVIHISNRLIEKEFERS